MPLYHISGPSGSGKSHAGRKLQQRKLKVIETDFEPGLSSWVNKDTSEKVVAPSGELPKEWVDAHAWLWDISKFEELARSASEEPVFVVGGAHNQKDVHHLFDKRFALFADTPILIERLQIREPDRWVDGSPELQGLIDWNERSKEYERANGAILIDGSQEDDVIADTILRYVGLGDKN